MVGRARFTVAAVLAALMSILLYQVALADSPAAAVCGVDRGVHKQVGDKRFSLKGVITDTVGTNPVTAITLCGVSVDVTDAKIKGDLNEAKTEKFLVTAVGKVDDGKLEAQEVRVHPNGKPSDEVGASDDDKDNRGGGRPEGKGKPEGVGKADNDKGGPPEVKGIDKAIQKLEKMQDKVEDMVEEQISQRASEKVPDRVIEALQRFIENLQKLLDTLKS